MQKNPIITFIFPGQGSQSLGMGEDLAKYFPIARDIFEQADQILGYKISSIAWEGPTEKLNQTLYTQPALLTHSVAVLKVLNTIHPELKPQFVAGHSMGEFSALVAAKSLNFEQTLKLVQKRAEFMQHAGENNPGKMAALLGAEIDLVTEICQSIRETGEIVQVANDNCPGQVVISGTITGVEKVLEKAKEAGVRRARVLPVSIASHSPLMNSAQNSFNKIIERQRFRNPSIPIVGNVSAKPMTSVEEIHSELKQQLISPVRWTDSMRKIIQHGSHVFFELGSGNVLRNLLKRIDPNVTCYQLSSPADFDNLDKALAV